MKTNSSTLATLLLGGLLAIAQSAFAQAPTCNQVLTQDCLYFPSTRYAVHRTRAPNHLYRMPPARRVP